MARPRTISDQQIVDAAREVFLEHGFSATTAEIARRAGVSEGTLFKRFATKEELFAQTVGLSDFHGWHQEIQALTGQGEMRSNLEKLSLLIVKTARQILPQLMMMWSRGQTPPVQHQGGHDPVSADIAVIAQYLQAEVKLGRLRPVDCEVVAHALTGALTSRIHREVLQGTTIDAEYFVKTLLDFWWPGLAPPAAPADSSKSE